ncbi:hypothetical protein ACF06X_33205 [Streptomyces sp. NPDC015346]|uniref:hypothetical protein n=1 Tax=Streptomyces sp. NPDC015346 TaxID=3364954 RepID=UPI0036F7F3D7
MHTGSPDELRRKEQRAQTIATQIAELLNHLEQTGPVTANAGRITGLAVTIRRTGNRWTAIPDRS